MSFPPSLDIPKFETPSLDGLLAKFGLTADFGGSTPISSIPGKTTVPDSARWDKLGQYSFYIGEANPKSGAIGRASDTPPGMNFNQVDLRIPPQSIGVSNAFASTVVATNNGVLEENNGVVFRTITLSGTTGIAPIKEVRGQPSKPEGVAAIASAIFPTAVSAVSKLVKDATRVISGSQPKIGQINPDQTGYYQFWLLHNFFIEYAEAKKTSRNIRLVFSSAKDNIGFVCTPVSFDLRRDASAPMLYRYQIVLRAWDVVDQGFSKGDAFGDDVPDASNVISIKKVLDRIRKARVAINDASNVIRGVQSDIFDILNVVNQGVLALKDAAGVGVQLIDFIPTIKSNASLLIVTNGNQWRQIGQDYDSAFQRLGISNKLTTLEVPPAKRSESTSSVSGSKIKSSKLSPTGELTSDEGTSPAALLTLNSVLDNSDLTDQIALSDLGRLPKSVSDQIAAAKLTAQDTSSGQVRGLVSKLGELSDNLAYASGTMDAVYAETFGLPAPTDGTRAPTEDDIILAASVEEAKDAFLSTLSNGNIFAERADDPFLSASNFISPDEKLVTPTSSYAITVLRGVTLDEIAQSNLGDAARGRDIAILNGLRAPYIDEDGFTLAITQAGGRAFLVRDRSSLELSQIVRIGGTGISETRRTILNIEDVGNSTYRVTVSGNSNLDSYSSSTSPYVKARLPGTVGSGDTILLPSTDAPDQYPTSRPTPISERLTFAEKVFLVDIALSPDGDLDVGPSGDASRSYGYQNAVQALRLLIETERGELEWHPLHGFDAAVGQRLNSDLVTVIEERLRAAITSDPRFSGADIFVTRDGSAYNVRVEAFGKQGTGRIPVEFKIPG